MTGILPSAVEFAILGAVAIQLLSLMELANVPKSQRPDFKDVIYWVPFVVHPLVGGGLAWAYIASNQALTPMLAINVGITAPLVLRTIATQTDRSIQVPPDA